MGTVLFSLTLALLFSAVLGLEPCTGRHVSETGEWMVEWTLSDDNLYIDFNVTAKTDGWVGIGFSPDNMMPNSDVVVGAASADGTQYFVSDRFTDDSRDAPMVDRYQNINNTEASQMTNNSEVYTTIRFTRPICSYEPNDHSLAEETYLLYAWGLVNNYDGNDRFSIQPHSMRGRTSTPINLICNVSREGNFSIDVNGIDFLTTWISTPDARYVNFTMTTTTDEWVAIGFSLNQMMANTEIIVGAADGINQSYVSDRYAAAQTTPQLDANPDISYESAMQVEDNGNTLTIINFVRPTYLNGEGDVSLDRDEGVYILHAWGMERNFDGSDPMSIMPHVPVSSAVSPNQIVFFRCADVTLVPNELPTTDAPATDAPATAVAAAATIASSLVIIFLCLIIVMNALI